MAQALGLGLDDDGAPLGSPRAAAPDASSSGAAAPEPAGSARRLLLELGTPPESVVTTARTGVSGEGGTDRFPWRFAIPGDPTVSPYRRASPKKRRTRGRDTTMGA